MSRIPTRLGVLALAAALAAPAVAHDPALILTLSAYHEDPGAEALAAFEPDLEAQLIAIVRDAEVRRIARVRALSSLGLLATPAAFEVVREVALDRAAPVRLRIAAARTLGHHFLEQPQRVEVLGAMLGDPDPGPREVAVRSLAHIGTDEAHARLEAHRAVERHVAVRTALREVRHARVPAGLPPEGRLQAAPAAGRLGPREVTP